MTKTNTTDISDKYAEMTGAVGPLPCLLLKTARAMKLGKHAEGGIHYQILTDSARQDVMFKIVRNDGGGYYSKETLDFSSVEACLAQHPQGQPFPSKLLQAAFTGRSSNNAGFLAAILRAEGLLALALDTEGRHVISGDWSGWKESMLEEPGESIDMELSDKQGKANGNENVAAIPDDEKSATRRGKK